MLTIGWGIHVALGENSDAGHGIKLAVSDPSQLGALSSWLRDQPGISVVLTPGSVGLGELGAVDLLTVLAGSTSLAAAIKTLPDFIRSRRSNFRIEATVKGQHFVLDATNVDEITPVLEQLLGE